MSSIQVTFPKGKPFRNARFARTDTPPIYLSLHFTATATKQLANTAPIVIALPIFPLPLRRKSKHPFSEQRYSIPMVCPLHQSEGRKKSVRRTPTEGNRNLPPHAARTQAMERPQKMDRNPHHQLLHIRTHPTERLPAGIRSKRRRRLRIVQRKSRCDTRPRNRSHAANRRKQPHVQRRNKHHQKRTNHHHRIRPAEGNNRRSDRHAGRKKTIPAHQPYRIHPGGQSGRKQTPVNRPTAGTESPSRIFIRFFQNFIIPLRLES